MLSNVHTAIENIKNNESSEEKYVQKYIAVIDIIIIIICVFGYRLVSEESNVWVYLLMLYLAYRISISSPVYTFLILLLLIPNLGIMYISVLNTSLPVLNILICFALAKVILQYTNATINKNYFLIIAFVVIYEWCHALYYDINSIMLLFSWSAAVLYASLFFISSRNVYNHSIAIKYFILGAFISTIYGILDFYLEYGTLMNNNMTIRFKGGAGDPNYFSMYIMIGIFSMVFLVNQNSNKFKKIFYPILFVFFVAFGVLSLSRMFLIVIVLSMLLLLLKVLFSMKENKKLIYFSLIIFSIVFLSAIYFNEEFTSMFNLLISRFTTNIGDASALTSERNILAEQYINLILSNPVDMTFGIGIQDYHIRAGLIPLEAHNIILEIFIVWGLIGFFVFTLFVVTLIKYGRSTSENTRHSLIGWLPIISMGISYMSINAMSTESFFLLLIFTIKNLNEYY